MCLGASMPGDKTERVTAELDQPQLDEGVVNKTNV